MIMIVDILKWILLAGVLKFLYSYIVKQFMTRRHYKSQKGIKVIDGYIPFLGDSLWTAKLFKNPHGANPVFADFLKIAPGDKAVLLQSPPKSTL